MYVVYMYYRTYICIRSGARFSEIPKKIPEFEISAELLLSPKAESGGLADPGLCQLFLIGPTLRRPH